MQQHAVHKITSQAEAVHWGRKSGWCTRHPNSQHWSTYSPDKGDLFVICKPGRELPSWQIFFSFRGHIELRDKQNQYVDPQQFFYDTAPDLSAWYDECRYPLEIPEPTAISPLDTGATIQHFATFDELYAVAPPLPTGTIVFVSEVNQLCMMAGEANAIPLSPAADVNEGQPICTPY